MKITPTHHKVGQLGVVCSGVSIILDTYIFWSLHLHLYLFSQNILLEHVWRSFNYVTTHINIIQNGKHVQNMIIKKDLRVPLIKDALLLSITVAGVKGFSFYLLQINYSSGKHLNLSLDDKILMIDLTFHLLSFPIC